MEQFLELGQVVAVFVGLCRYFLEEAVVFLAQFED